MDQCDRAPSFTVTAQGSGFVGTLTKNFPAPAGQCYSVGERVWTIDLLQRRSEGRYAGTVFGHVNDPGCTRVTAFATWDLTSDGNSLQQCTEVLGTSVCSDLKRIVDVGRVRFKIVNVSPNFVGPTGKNGAPGPGYDFSSGAGSIDYMGTSITEHGATTFTHHFFKGKKKKQTIVLKVLGLAQKPDLDGSCW